MFPILYFADIPDQALDMFDQCCCRFPKYFPSTMRLLVLSHNLLICNWVPVNSRDCYPSYLAVCASPSIPTSLLFLLQRCQCISIFRIDQICWQQSSLIYSHFIRQMKIFLWEEVNILMLKFWSTNFCSNRWTSTQSDNSSSAQISWHSGIGSNVKPSNCTLLYLLEIAYNPSWSPN